MDYLARLEDKLNKYKDNAYLNYLYNNRHIVDLVSKICVQIPDYCDPEMLKTMESCVKAAANPDRIYFAVCYQGDDLDEFAKIKAYPNCEAVHINKINAPGLCAARHICTKLTSDDMDFIMHTDSHMRFAEFWDVCMIDQWRACNDENAILACYCPNYNDSMDDDLVSDDRLPKEFNGMYINPSKFYNDGLRLKVCAAYKFDSNSFKPRLSPFMSGHCSFMPLRIDRDVISDPDMYFVADEQAMAVRYWTHGYNMYQNGIRCMYHLYTRSKIANVERFNTKGDHDERREIETKRLEKMFNVVDHEDVDLGEFGLGKVRTLEEYQEFCGVNFKDATITKYGYSGAFDQSHMLDEYDHIDYNDTAKAFNKLYGNFEKYKNETIAVMMYSYADKNVLYSINKLAKTARYQNRLHFYVAYTDLDDDTLKSLKERAKELNITMLEIEYKGRSYARSMITKELQGETYVMYTQSFIVSRNDWDIYYVNMMKRLGRKSVISEKLNTFDELVETENMNNGIVPVAPYNIHNDYSLVFFIGSAIKNVDYLRGAFVHFSFMFAYRDMVKDCPFDDKLMDGQLYLNQALKLWTHGYDVYHANGTYIMQSVRCNDADIIPKESEDIIKDMYKDSKRRLEQCYGFKNYDIDLEEYVLGSDRSIELFENYTGIDIKKKFTSFKTVSGRYEGYWPELCLKKFDMGKLRSNIVKEHDKFYNVITYVLDHAQNKNFQNEVINKLHTYDMFTDIQMTAENQNDDGSVCTIKPEYTVRQVLEIMFEGDKLTEALEICKDCLDKAIVSVYDSFPQANNGIFMNIGNNDKINGKPVLVISRKNVEADCPVIVEVDLEGIWGKFASNVKQRSNAKSVIITGSDGKTTTTNIISEVLKEDCGINDRFVNSNKTKNGVIGFFKDVNTYFKDVKYYVKEFGVGGASDCLTWFTKAFQPDISVLLNIGGSCHFELFKDRQEVFDTKVRIIDGLKSDGVLIYNKDDDMLKKAEYPCKTISIAIEDKSADYTCKDIVEENDHIMFTIVCPDREIKNVRMNVHGTHNIYGALVATAIADRFGVSDDKILRGLAKFEYDGIRQTMYKDYKNNTIIYDCFGCSVESDIIMLKSLMSLKVPEGARHIAFLGHMATTGYHSDELHRKLAKTIASDFDLDLLITYGGKSKYFYEEYVKVGKKAVFFNDDIEAMCYIRKELREGDALLVKGCGTYRFGSLFKDNLNNDDLKLPEYKGKYADLNDFHGVSKVMLCENLNNDEILLEKCSDIKCVPYAVSTFMVIVTLCDIYKNRLDMEISCSQNAWTKMLKYNVPTRMLENRPVIQLQSGKHKVKELLRVALDYAALNILYELIEHIGRHKFEKRLNSLLSDLGCNDTHIVDPYSRDEKDNVTTANDVYKIVKYFVNHETFNDIISIDADQFIPISDMRDWQLTQKSKMIRFDKSDEEDTYCENVLFAKKIYDTKKSSCISVAKVDDEYIAAIALDRALVYTNHACEADASRMIKTYIKCKNNEITDKDYVVKI